MAKKRNIETDLFGLPVREDSINSKNKGNVNERVASNWTSKWTGEKFTRIPSSGGLRWKNAAKTIGDIVCENDQFDYVFCTETKHLQRIPMPKVLMSKKLSNGDMVRSKVFTIWEQAYRDSLRAGGKIPMLLIRENKMPADTYYLFVDREVGEFFTDNGAKCISVGKTVMYIDGEVTLFDIMGFNSSEILEKIPYQIVYSFVKNTILAEK